VANLHGKVLLMHGETDDNVHMQNSIQFAYELQHAGKPFEMMVYAKSRHSFDDALLIKHRQQTMYDFVLKTVGVTPPVSRSSVSSLQNPGLSKSADGRP
jgi:dipeptidyl-peptidase-4